MRRPSRHWPALRPARSPESIPAPPPPYARIRRSRGQLPDKRKRAATTAFFPWADSIYVRRLPPSSGLQRNRRSLLRGDDHQRGARARAAAMVAVRHRRIEIDRVARLEYGLLLAHREHQLSAQHVDEFDPVMLVLERLSLRSRREVGQVGIELALDGVEVEALEKERCLFRLRPNRKTLALFLARHGENVAAAIIGEKIAKAHAEHERHPQQRRQGREQPTAFNLRDQSGREAGMAGELDESDLLAQAQFPDFFANRVVAKSVLQGFREHRVPCFSP